MTITLRPFDSVSHRSEKREINKDWKSGEETVKPGEFRSSETVIRFSVYHSKERKEVVASITPLEYHDNFVQWNSDNPGVRILSERVGRYSEKALNAFADTAYKFLIENADDPRITKVLDQVPGIINKEV